MWAPSILFLSFSRLNFMNWKLVKYFQWFKDVKPNITSEPLGYRAGRKCVIFSTKDYGCGWCTVLESSSAIPKTWVLFFLIKNSEKK